MPSSLGRSSKAHPKSQKPINNDQDTVLHRINALVAQLPPSSPANSDLNPLAQLVQLYTELDLNLDVSTSSPQHLQHNRQRVHTAIHSIKSIFEALIQLGRMHGVPKHKRAKVPSGSSLTTAVTPESDAVLRVKQWLNDRYSEFLSKTADVVGQHWDVNVRISALNAMMNLVRSEASFLTSLHRSRQAQFPVATFSHVVRAILVPAGDDGLLRTEIKDEWFKWWNRDDDIRFYFLKQAASLCQESATKTPPPHLCANLITLLESLTTMPTVPSELNTWWCSTPLALKPTIKASGNKKRKLSASPSAQPVDDGATGIFDSSSSEGEYDEPVTSSKLNSRDSKKLLPPLLSLPAHRRAFQDAYLALLALPMSEAESKRVLSMLHRQVLPHMTDPRRLMDWLVDCIGQGGTVAILALNGLFTLMTKHNLEYPDFYTRLYGLLDQDVLHVRYRPRFFRLLVVFMSSSHLPSSLVASFLKRLARLALSAPPAAIVTVVPFIYNLLKVHPACMPMIHRASADEDEDDRTAFEDPFLPLEPNPNSTHALESSLWELKTLQAHYLASVAGLAKVFNEAMTKQSYGLEDFLDHSYATLFDTEVARKMTKAPALAPVPKRQPIGNSLFPLATDDKITAERDVGEEEVEEEPVDVVAAMWRF